MFKDLSSALDWLYCQKKSQKREDLSRIDYCIKSLDLKLKYKKIHVAGTNGKGSTICMLKRILELKGYNVGIFISPFVICFNERIQINGEFIADELVINYCNQLKAFAEKYYEDTSDTIPFFELTFLMALLHFDCNNIDVAIIECGLGGKLDATNCLDTDLQIITNIGYDHMQQLGNTLEEIAEHKLGITISGKKCLTCVDSSLKDYFNKYSDSNNVEMVYVNEKIDNIESNEYLEFSYKGIFYKARLNAYYQANNAALAIEAAKQFDHSINEDLINKALTSSYWPGRFEYVRENIIIDGAHNIHGINALVESVKNKYRNKKIKIVFTALFDKLIKEMIEALDTIADSYYFTTIVDKRATEISLFEGLTKKPYQLIENVEKALKKAVKELNTDEILIITGSLHFISIVREYFKK